MILLYGLELYVLLGLITAILFVSFGVTRVLPYPMTLGARLLVLPGAAALWPYVLVRWRNPSAPSPAAPLTLPVEAGSETGLSVASGVGGVRLRFAFAQPRSFATAAAGGRLARLWDGRWAAPPGRIPLAFGIARPARDMAFARPGRLAGFRFDRLTVRTGDFEGREKLPEDPALPGELMIRKGLPPQHGWAAVTIGADRLSRCAEVVYRAEPRSLTLDCAFDAP